VHWRRAAVSDGINKPPRPIPTSLQPYRSTLVTFLRQSLTVGPSQLYVVCVQFNPRGQIKTTKAAVYLSRQMTQFIDATPEQCADAVYQPFKELEAATPPATLPSDLSDPRGMH
jgi:hypothetical protein